MIDRKQLVEELEAFIKWTLEERWQFCSDPRGRIGHSMSNAATLLKEDERKLENERRLNWSDQVKASGETIRKLRAELEEARVVLTDVVKAMRLWGSWEDGIPEAGQDAHGSVGPAFNRACDVLDLDWLADDPLRNSLSPTSPETQPDDLPVDSMGTCEICGYHGPGPAHDCRPKCSKGKGD
jgi:hypothetical protein